MSKIDLTRYFVLFALSVVPFLPGSFRAIAQDAGSAILVSPPIHTKGNAQPATVGLTPSQVRRAYGFDLIPNHGAGQTIAVVEAFGDPQIEKDLATFDQTFNLPPCTTSNGCLRIVTTTGNNLKTSQLWSLETSLDVEWAHAIAPDAQILVVESPDAVLTDMLQAVDFAVTQGATVVSMSWGGMEFPGETALDAHFSVGAAQHVSFVAAAGDFGSGVIYPAASPYVLAVGGTTLSLKDTQGTYSRETAWSGSGGGISTAEPEPDYQSAFPIPFRGRGNPDVAYNANPDAGFSVFATHKDGFQGFNGWVQVGGTSAGAPQWAAFLAIARSMGFSPASPGATNSAIYSAGKGKASYSTNFHDIVTGSNGTCGVVCTALSGYDYITGIGSPQAQNLAKALQP